MDDNTNAVSIADMVFETVRGHAECYAAGVRAADANSPSARKLARLIDQVEAAMYENGGNISWDALRAALEEARR